ncbi:MAG: AI-2E family transporter [Bacteroidia bacterium]
MTRKNQILLLALLAVLLTAAWFIRVILLYICIAAVITIILRPLEKRLERVRIRKRKIPRGIRAALLLSGLFIVLGLLISVFTPLVVDEINTLSSVTNEQITKALKVPIDQANELFRNFQQTTGEKRTAEQFVQDSIGKFVDMTQLSSIAGSIFSTMLSLISGILIVSFFVFFFLKDGPLIFETLLISVPKKYQEGIRNIVDDSTRMLTLYFTGVLLDVLFVSTFVGAGMWILGIRNALTIGLFAGVMNIIPYLGPLIGAVFAIFIGISTNLHLEFYSGLLPLAGKIGLVFLLYNLTDGFFVQPYIFSNTVRAHPIEIFTVILVAGTLAGIGGMIAAVPVYTVLRIVAKEFLSHYVFIRKITDEIEDDP